MCVRVFHRRTHTQSVVYTICKLAYGGSHLLFRIQPTTLRIPSLIAVNWVARSTTLTQSTHAERRVCVLVFGFDFVVHDLSTASTAVQNHTSDMHNFY